jgi:Transcription factor WhiB
MPRMTLDDIDVMVRLREQGQSLSAIRRCVQWSETTISLVLHRLAHGVSPEQVTERPGWGGPRRRITHVAAPTLPILPGALCAGDPDPDLWFRAEDEDEAVAACRWCPVIDQCRAWALEAGVRDGIWGGMTESQLRAQVDQQVTA